MNQGIERLAEMDNRDKSKPNSDEAKERRPKWMIPLIAVVVVSVLALAGVFAWRAYEHRQHDRRFPRVRKLLAIYMGSQDRLSWPDIMKP